MLPVIVGDNIIDVLVDRDIISIGGNCLNVAVHMNRQGQPTRYVGSVGNDAAGQWLLRSLDREGIDISAISVLPGQSTGYAMIHHRGEEREFGDFDRGASQPEISEAQWEVLATASLIHTTYSSGLEDQLPRLGRIAPLSFDFDTHVNDDYANSLLPFVSHAFFSGAGRDVSELREYGSHLLSVGVESVTITRGADGSLHWRGGREWSQPARSIEAVDTLGAGDAYIARMLVGFGRGEAPNQSMSAAADLAADVCRTLGSLGWNAPVVGSPEASDYKARSI